VAYRVVLPKMQVSLQTCRASSAEVAGCKHVSAFGQIFQQTQDASGILSMPGLK